MKKLQFNNEIYYYQNNIFYDEHFIQLDDAEMKKISNLYFNSIDYKQFDQEELIEYIINIKERALYKLVFSVCKYGYQKFDTSNFKRRILPILTSSLRNINKPKVAIEVALQNINNYATSSKALFTSLAAAYCDIKDFDNARRYINRAYAIQGGGKNEVNEISLVYKRIKAETDNR